MGELPVVFQEHQGIGGRLEEDIEVGGQPPQQAVPRHGRQLRATRCGLGEGRPHDALTERVHVDVER